MMVDKAKLLRAYEWLDKAIKREAMPDAGPVAKKLVDKMLDQACRLETEAFTMGVTGITVEPVASAAGAASAVSAPVVVPVIDDGGVPVTVAA